MNIDERVAKLPKRIRYEVCRRFFLKKLSATTIAEQVRAEFGETIEGVRVTRELVYPILARGRDEGVFELYAPLSEDLAQSVRATFGVRKPSVHASARASVHASAPVQVVDFRGKETPLEVVNRAAVAALELIRELGRRKRKTKGPDVSVHVGFASGATVSRVAAQLAEEIRRNPRDVPPLTLHATSPGFDEKEPGHASTTFLSFYADLPLSISYVGLFGPTFVDASGYEAATLMPGARFAFSQRKKIDLVISALARAEDKHSELRRFIEFHAAAAGAPSDSRPIRGRKGKHADDKAPGAPVFTFPSADVLRGKLKEAGWEGDVHYCAFSASGSIEILPFVPLTLFGIDDLVAHSQSENKAMLLVAGPCGICNESRAGALYHLMRNPKLKVWTHVVMDAQTADELLAMDRARLEEQIPPRA